MIQHINKLILKKQDNVPDISRASSPHSSPTAMAQFWMSQPVRFPRANLPSCFVHVSGETQPNVCDQLAGLVCDMYVVFFDKCKGTLVEYNDIIIAYPIFGTPVLSSCIAPTVTCELALTYALQLSALSN